MFLRDVAFIQNSKMRTSEVNYNMYNAIGHAIHMLPSLQKTAEKGYPVLQTAKSCPHFFFQIGVPQPLDRPNRLYVARASLSVPRDAGVFLITSSP